MVAEGGLGVMAVLGIVIANNREKCERKPFIWEKGCLFIPSLQSFDRCPCGAADRLLL